MKVNRNGLCHMTKMPIYANKLSNLLLWNRKADELETWYAASNTRVLPNIKSEMRSLKSNENIHKKEGGSYYVVSANKASSVTQFCSNDAPGLTLTYLVPNACVWEKIKTMNFSEIIV